MKKALIALAVGTLVIGPAGAAYAYDEPADVNDNGLVCVNFETGHRADDYFHSEWVGDEETGYEQIYQSCPDDHSFAGEGSCLPDGPYGVDPADCPWLGG